VVSKKVDRAKREGSEATRGRLKKGQWQTPLNITKTRALYYLIGEPVYFGGGTANAFRRRAKRSSI
jgi:hypothetical protein